MLKLYKDDVWALATGRKSTAYAFPYKKWLRGEFSPDSHNPQIILTCHNKNNRKKIIIIHCCNAADSFTFPCSWEKEWGEAAIRGSELTTELCSYTRLSHHHKVTGDAACGWATAYPGLLEATQGWCCSLQRGLQGRVPSLPPALVAIQNNSLARTSSSTRIP